MDKKKNILFIAGIALLSLNLATNTNSVSASSHAELTHNAYVYNIHGVRVRRGSLKHGKTITILGKKTIHGKRYIRIGRNQYVKAANLRNNNFSAVSSGKLTHNSFIYKSNGRRVGHASLKRGQIVSILGTKTIKGKKYYRIGKNQYIKIANIGDLNLDNTNKTNNDAQKNNSNSSSTQFNQTNNSKNLSNSVNSNSSSNKKDHSDSLVDGKDLEIKQDCLVYDQNGKHLLAQFASAGQHADVIGQKTINGEDYYQIDSTSIEYDDGSGDFVGMYPDKNAYIKVSAFSDGNNQNLPTPATNQELLALRKYANEKSYDVDTDNFGDKYDLSSWQLRKTYDNAVQTAKDVASDIRSSSDDISRAKQAIQDAGNSLNGKPVNINSDYSQWNDGKYKLSATEKDELFKTAEKVLDVSSVNFADDSEKQLIYHDGNSLQTVNTQMFLKFLPRSTNN